MGRKQTVKAPAPARKCKLPGCDATVPERKGPGRRLLYCCQAHSLAGLGLAMDRQKEERAKAKADRDRRKTIAAVATHAARPTAD